MIILPYPVCRFLNATFRASTNKCLSGLYYFSLQKMLQTVKTSSGRMIHRNWFHACSQIVQLYSQIWIINIYATRTPKGEAFVMLRFSSQKLLIYTSTFCCKNNITVPRIFILTSIAVCCSKSALPWSGATWAMLRISHSKQLADAAVHFSVDAWCTSWLNDFAVSL